MGDREGRHCRWIHEWERLRGLGRGGGEKDDTEKDGIFVAAGRETDRKSEIL